jgi:hypothetical protein
MKTISSKHARKILYAYHSGQASAFYAAASSGLVDDFYSLRQEIRYQLESSIFPIPEKEKAQHKADMEKLSYYLAKHEKTAPYYATHGLPHHRSIYQALLWFDQSRTDVMPLELPILSIDAWRESEGGWTWNDAHKLAVTIPADCVNWSNRKLLAYLRNDAGILSDKSAGRISIERDDRYITINEKANGRPLYAIDLEDLFK